MPRIPGKPLFSKRDVGARVRALRSQRGLSQVALAQMLGTHQTAVSQIEVGRRGVSVQQVIKLARALKVTPDEILAQRPSAEAVVPLRNGRLLKKLEQINTLPPPKQRALMEIIEAYIDKHGREESGPT